MKLSDDVSRYHRPAQYESKRKRNCNTIDIICKKSITCTIISNCLNEDLTSIIPIADTLEHVYNICNALLKLVEQKSQTNAKGCLTDQCQNIQANLELRSPPPFLKIVNK